MSPSTAESAQPAASATEPTAEESGSTTAPATTTQAGGVYHLAAKLRQLIESTGHNEIYGVELQSWTEGSDIPVPQQIILQKFLRANAGDVTKAMEQLEGALKWRKEFQPLKTMNEVFDKSAFQGLGYVAELKGVPGGPNATDIAVFNIYGAVKDDKKTFGDIDGFIRWRVALMELTLAALHLQDAKTPLPDYGEGADPYQAYQIHDYLSVSFLRQAPEVKAASSKTIQLFQAVYPETVCKKFFVNVPIFMQWMFAAMQLFMAKETIAKMKWMSYGTELHKDLGPGVSKAYGGSGPELATSATTPRYESATMAPSEPTATEAAESSTA